MSKSCTRFAAHRSVRAASTNVYTPNRYRTDTRISVRRLHHRSPSAPCTGGPTGGPREVSMTYIDTVVTTVVSVIVHRSVAALLRYVHARRTRCTRTCTHAAHAAHAHVLATARRNTNEFLASRVVTQCETHRCSGIAKESSDIDTDAHVSYCNEVK